MFEFSDTSACKLRNFINAAKYCMFADFFMPLNKLVLFGLIYMLICSANYLLKLYLVQVRSASVFEEISRTNH